MKNKFLTFGTAFLFLFGMGLIMSCGGNSEPPTNLKAGTYYCPMHHDITSDNAGSCSKCGMDLVIVEGEAMEHGEGEHEHAADEENGNQMAMYYCTMKCEGDKTYHEPGKCPVCKMDLVKSENDDHEGHDHESQEADEHAGHNHD